MSEQKYWYEYEYEECVLCGRHHETKRRIYDRPKPENPEDRHIYIQFACSSHFI